MKLLDILVREWKVWPAGQAVEQTCLGDIFCTTYGRNRMYGYCEIAEDQDIAVVTRAHWEEARAQ